MNRFCSLALTLSLAGIVAFCDGSQSHAQFDDLMRRVPGGANALVLIDVDALFQSPMAIKKGWKEASAKRWDEQPILLPPEAKRFILASHLDPLNNLRSDWEAAVIELAEPLSMPAVARAQAGYIDSIDRTEVVWAPSRTYIIEVDKQLLGMVHPDDRQAVSRWLRLARTGQLAPLSPYLKEAAKRLRSKGQIVLALDLADVAQLHRVDRALKESKVLDKNKVNPRAVANVIYSLKGITLTIDVRSQALAEARVDFGQDIRAIKPFAKNLVLEGMDRFGASLSDPDAWKATIEDRAIVLRGQLSEAGLRRISGLLELPTMNLSASHSEDKHAGFSTSQSEGKPTEIPQDAGKPSLEASRRYYKTLEKLIADLRQNSQKSNLWFEKTARKIDAIPLMNVDEELLGFGSWLSKQLRNMAEGMRVVGREYAVAQSEAYLGNGYYGAYGNYYGPSPGAIRNTQAVQTEQAIQSTGTVRTRGMQQIDNGMADIRRIMTKKYKVEF